MYIMLFPCSTYEIILCSYYCFMYYWNLCTLVSSLIFMGKPQIFSCLYWNLNFLSRLFPFSLTTKSHPRVPLVSFHVVYCNHKWPLFNSLSSTIDEIFKYYHKVSLVKSETSRDISTPRKTKKEWLFPETNPCFNAFNHKTPRIQQTRQKLGVTISSFYCWRTFISGE